MISKIVPRGHSFIGAVAYVTHDPDRAETADRVAWIQSSDNLPDDPALAARVMAFTDMNADTLKQKSGLSSAGRKVESGSVGHDVLSWARGETPDEQHQRATVKSYLEARGLAEHQYIAAGHNDTDHVHVHIIINLTNPETGRRADLSFEKVNAQKWALDYEREHGMYCKQRLENEQQRKQEQAKDFYHSKKETYGEKITRAYEACDNGQSFQSALEAEGLTLAKGRKSFVAVDKNGDILNLSRMVEGYKTKDVTAKLSDLNREHLPDADELSAVMKTEKQALSAQDMVLPTEGKQAKARTETQNPLPLPTRDPASTSEKRPCGKLEPQISAQDHIDTAISQSRTRWQIDELTEARDMAAQDVQAADGLWARLLGRQRQALEALALAEKRLEERRILWQKDIDMITSSRSPEFQREVLDKTGFEVSGLEKDQRALSLDDWIGLHRSAVSRDQPDQGQLSQQYNEIMKNSGVRLREGEDAPTTSKIENEKHWELDR